MKRLLGVLLGAALGASGMYLFDPNGGRARRARLREESRGAARRSVRATRSTASAMRNRIRGAVCHLVSAIRDEAVSPEVLVSRVRARMGHVVPHAHQIGVSAEGGRVVLTGLVGEHEVERLIAAVQMVPGVDVVRNELTIVPAEDAGSDGARRDPAIPPWRLPAAALLPIVAAGGAVAYLASSHHAAHPARPAAMTSTPPTPPTGIPDEPAIAA